MSKFRIVLCFLYLILLSAKIQAQAPTQNIRGTVRDKQTQIPLEGAAVSLIKGATNTSVYTDKEGRFELPNIPVGRVDLSCSMLGYNPVQLKELLLSSGKELILNIELEEKVTQSKEVRIKSKRDKDKALNEMAVVSARMFSVEETNKYAGSLNDPARMAQNFAGVQANGDTRNDIIIRGNSPLGVLWRLEGIDIPNPNHFAGIGTSGGAISILNNNNLANSDFLTGAFPAQYGNAMAGVFDLKLRKGNDKKYEHMIMFGMNGLEGGTEGPLSNKSKASYMLNYRYSTLGIFNALGINFGAAAVPKYQDLVFKLHIPTKNGGTWELFGIGGYNSSTFYSKDFDTTGRKLNPMPKGFNTTFKNHMAVAGITHTIHFKPKLMGRFVATYSSNGNITDIDSLYNNESEKFLWLKRYYQEQKLNAQYQLNYKFNSQHHAQVGLFFNRTYFNVNDSFYLSTLQTYRRIFDFKGAANLLRLYAQHQYKPNNDLSIVVGANAMYFSRTNSWVVEPRIGMRYQVAKKMWLTAGAGIHHQTQPTSVYFYQTRLASGVDTATNGQLDFSRSHHAIVGLDWMLGSSMRLKLEAYYQYLNRLPVEQVSSSYSMINEGADYVVFTRPYLVNQGTGYNRGLELTLERFLSKNYYFLLTGSWYKSRYRGSDGIERHTAFDGTYAANVLAGYDLPISKKATLSINAKATLLGGRRYTPVDIAASQASWNTRYIDTLAYSLKHPAYFRPDIRIAYRLNWKKITQEWAFNINNFINRDNIDALVFDRQTAKVGYSYQVGFFPVFQYRIEF